MSHKKIRRHMLKALETAARDTYGEQWKEELNQAAHKMTRGDVNTYKKLTSDDVRALTAALQHGTDVPMSRTLPGMDKELDSGAFGNREL